MEVESKLNEKQLESVKTESQYTRVIAGAGTGKTRVLTYRIGYLISYLNIEPWSILAITFTNKAAQEMLERVKSFFPDSTWNMWISTFHSFCARFLRYEIKVLEAFTPNFHILDEEDQESLVKRIMINKGFKKSDEITKLTLNFIKANKGAGLYPDNAIFEGYPPAHHRELLKAYEDYEYEKTSANSLDFDDLILVTIRILSNYPDIRNRWQKRFSHILVDEFQDTDNQQYELIRLLMNVDTSLYVVGDPDQTIYTWRGARQEIIMNLERDFPDLITIILGQNYRSTQQILDPANQLISKNKNRIHKDLMAVKADGAKVEVYSENLAHLEANYICRQINTLLRNGHSHNDIAILYRSNYLSLNLEKQFMRYQLPYSIYGSIKFYQRAEIKDALAYLSLVDNIKDNLSFHRIINVPKRGIGDVALKTITSNCTEYSLSLAEYLTSTYAVSQVKPSALSSLRNMLEKVNTLQDVIFKFQAGQSNLDAIDALKAAFTNFFKDIGYFAYVRECLENPEDRIENLEALIQDVVNFMRKDQENPFSEYLNNVALMSHQDEIKEGDTIKLMTVHVAKGLEFPVIFLFSFNEGVFPSNRSIVEGGGPALEEERRLAYVAMTRAKSELIITYNTDFSYISRTQQTPSSFLEEAGLKVKNKAEASKNAFKDFFQKQNPGVQLEIEPVVRNPVVNNNISWEIGDRLVHERLGKGTIVKIDSSNKIVVEFDSGKLATLVGSTPALKKEDSVWS